MGIVYSELEDEVRDGFYVNSLMKCCWKAQLQVLEEIDKVCRKHNIQYQAEWGTLLGTVRHGGFIPWDDDMDISMKRQDYNKFIEIAQQELPEGYWVGNYRSVEDYWDILTKIKNSRKFSFEHEYLDKNANFPFNVIIDIFPLDFLPEDEEEREILKNLILDVQETADAYGAGILMGEELEERLKQLELLCHVKINREGNLREHLYDLMISLYALYQEDEAKELTLMPVWAETGGCTYPKEYYSKTAEIPFEDRTIPIPIAYDNILKRKYGDYMKMVRKGGSHNYPFYKKELEVLESKGYLGAGYRFTDRVVRNSERMSEKRIANLGTEQLQILEKAHFMLYKLFLVEETDAAIEVLVSCQECAINFGESIGKQIIGCDNIICFLEEYCELVYQVYQLILEGERPDVQGVFLILQEQLERIKKECSKEYELKKKIVFVTDKASRWKSLEGIWKVAKEDEDCVVSVIVIPYAYKRIDGSILEEHFEKDKFPEYVEIEDYRTFSLEKYHPDVIYINSPYDEYNYLTNIHPDFYSSKLIHVCEKLVYIPWFVLSELSREDERGWQSMKYFVTKPGVVNADQVIVQSEQMKQAYVDYLTDWAGEETRVLWEEKICGLGSPLMDLKDNEKVAEENIPEKWKHFLYKENEERKKVILYYVPMGSIIDYKQKAIDKLQRVLQIFEENSQDVCLLWYQDEIMEETLKSNYPDLWERLQEIVETYKKEAWGIYEREAEKEMLSRICDAYYGDGSVISQAMVMAEKPVMLQNYDC